MKSAAHLKSLLLKKKKNTLGKVFLFNSVTLHVLHSLAERCAVWRPEIRVAVGGVNSYNHLY